MSEIPLVRGPTVAGAIVLVVGTALATRVTSLAAGTATATVESTRMTELLKENRLLVSRVSKLEEDVARLGVVATQTPARVVAPFEVVDGAGNSLFMVTGDHGSGLGKNSRVRIGRASGDNFALTVRNHAGVTVAALGEAKTGAGTMSVTDSKAQYLQVEAVGDLGFILNNTQGKEIANLGFTPGDNGQSRLQVNGELRAVDGAGNPIFAVTDAPGAALSSKARVTVASGSNDNFSLTIRNRSGAVVGAFTEVKTGGGGIELSDAAGKFLTDISGDLGYRLKSSDGKEIANLGFDAVNKGVGLFRLRGEIRSEDAAGKPIFTVSDATSGDATVGRVHVGRGATDNYGIWIRGGAGKVAAAIGEGKTGGGVVTVSDPSGKRRADLYGQGGLAVYNTSGKEVVTLTLRSDNTESGLLQLRGIFQLSDAAGQTMAEAGTSPNGVGVVRVGPMAKCVPQGDLRVPDCIMGRSHP